MLEREWVTIADPDDQQLRYRFDTTFLLSSYTCIYGRGCPGSKASLTPDVGCCGLGAYYVDDDDRAKIEALAMDLGADEWQHRRKGRRGGITRLDDEGAAHTRVVDGACIFLNRDGFLGGAGCALHRRALAEGVHPLHRKPEVCWLVPLRREVEESVGDDGEPVWTTTITSFDRGAWGPGGADFTWWCTTDGDDAFVGEQPVYRSMEAELRAMSSDGVYAELSAYLERRFSAEHPALPMPAVARGPAPWVAQRRALLPVVTPGP